MLSPDAHPQKIEIVLQPKQELLRWYVEESPKTVIGYGGSRGGAKSHGGRSVLLLRRWKWPGTRGLILRRKYKELKENHIDPLFDEFPQLREWYNVADKTLTFPNGAALVFWHAETFSDLKALQGAGFMDVMVDEATHFHQLELEWLGGINRQTGVADSECKTIYTCNPGEVGHAYIQRVCVERKDYRENEDAKAYAFIQAYAWDNVYWSVQPLRQDAGFDPVGFKALTFHERKRLDNSVIKRYFSWTDAQRFEYFITRTGYGQKLNALAPDLRMGWLMGKWDQFAGQYFDCWNPDVHVAKREAGGKLIVKVPKQAAA
jgi:hypothetical protein